MPITAACVLRRSRKRRNPANAVFALAVTADGSTALQRRHFDDRPNPRRITLGKGGEAAGGTGINE